MKACWLFKSLVGSSCGFDAKDRKRQNKIVPLVSCSRISPSTWGACHWTTSQT